MTFFISTGAVSHLFPPLLYTIRRELCLYLFPLTGGLCLDQCVGDLACLVAVLSTRARNVGLALQVIYPVLQLFLISNYETVGPILRDGLAALQVGADDRLCRYRQADGALLADQFAQDLVA